MNFGILNGGGRSDNRFADSISPIRLDSGSTCSDFSTLIRLVAFGTMAALSFAAFAAPARGSASAFAATYPKETLLRCART